MGRASGNNSAARSATARRRKRRAPQDVKDFIAGRTDTVKLELGPVPRGPEAVLGGPRGGVHGKQGKAAHKASRRDTRNKLRSGDWD